MSTKKSPADKKYNYLIQSVIKSLDILEEINNTNGEIGIKELSERLGIGKSTVHRFFATLEYKGYIEQVEEKGKYRVSLKLFEMGNKTLKSLDIHSRSLPVLQDLNKRLSETVHLVVLDKGEAVFINKLVNHPTMITYSHIGKRSPAHCLASGKVLLAYLSQEKLESIIQERKLPQYTPNTITEPVKLKEQLAKIREDGIAYDFEEYEFNVNCVAAPIKNHLGEVIAAISISGFTPRLDQQEISKLSLEVRQAAQKISENLGYPVR